MDGRYERNIGALSEEEQAILLTKSVLVVGVGGLGGYSAEFLARIGIKQLRLCDCDAFEASNLNRQLNSIEKNIGRRKVEVAAERIREINGDIEIVAFDERLCEDNAEKIIGNADIVVDALDNIKSRLVLEAAAQKMGVPLVFGAVSGWDGQVSTIIPGKPILAKLYKGYQDGALPVLPFAAASVSAYQVAEAVKVMLGEGDLRGKLLVVDLESYENRVFSL